MAPASQTSKVNGGGMLIIWDFDRTIMDEDSDRWVVVEMGLTQLFNHLRQSLPWNCLMDRMMEEVHSLGKTIDDIVSCLNRVPLHPHVVSAIKSAHARGCDLKVLSDANQFFIETILKNHGIYDCFSDIITNPTFVDKEGRLRIFPYHGSAVLPHGCDLCPPNLCKGFVLNQFQELNLKDVQKQVIIYIGDGGGDYCPTLKLGEDDHVLPRKNFPLHRLILKSATPVKPKIHEWNDGEELNKTLLQLIDPVEA
uniref:thiamine phosphate phosphatase-like protein n=1 Tax=Erigeron canadensis TaxID=72917 RepID=UPI001CB9A8FA|nr:thiamine phosphate phosphatase-like protein [Erigeron canadensis]